MLNGNEDYYIYDFIQKFKSCWVNSDVVSCIDICCWYRNLAVPYAKLYDKANKIAAIYSER